MKSQLLSKIHDHTAVISIIGLENPALTFAVAFAENGFKVIGIDVDGGKVDAVNPGDSYISDISSQRLAPLGGKREVHNPKSEIRNPKLISATTDHSAYDWGQDRRFCQVCG